MAGMGARGELAGAEAEAAVARFVAQARAATPEQRRLALAGWRRLVERGTERPALGGTYVPLAVVRRAIAEVEALR